MVASYPRRPDVVPQKRGIIAEKYINMRTQAHTRIHARKLQEWLDSGRSDESYWKDYREQVTQTATWYANVCADIERDSATSWTERETAKRRAAERLVMPAWTGVAPGVMCDKRDCGHSECSFLRSNGNPYVEARQQFEAGIEALKGPVWENALRGGQPVTLQKHPWELTFYDALVSPKDGSLPITLTVYRPLEPMPIRLARPEEYAGQPLSDPMKKALDAMLPLMCEFCGKVGANRGAKAQHQRRCAQNPNAEPPLNTFHKKAKLAAVEEA
ncbi:MAG: hypothetical protein NUW01_18195 [Gemmatimonadaceae bacterium]|nr:hypothetical protein [Gemmatimonadaceae bacterium]